MGREKQTSAPSLSDVLMSRCTVLLSERVRSVASGHDTDCGLAVDQRRHEEPARRDQELYRERDADDQVGGAAARAVRHDR